MLQEAIFRGRKLSIGRLSNLQHTPKIETMWLHGAQDINFRFGKNDASGQFAKSSISKNASIEQTRFSRCCENCASTLITCVIGWETLLDYGRSKESERCPLCCLSRDCIESAFSGREDINIWLLREHLEFLFSGPKDISLNYHYPKVTLELNLDDSTRMESLIMRCGGQAFHHALRLIPCKLFNI
jgi:hypothetical protein